MRPTQPTNLAPSPSLVALLTPDGLSTCCPPPPQTHKTPAPLCSRTFLTALGERPMLLIFMCWWLRGFIHTPKLPTFSTVIVCRLLDANCTSGKLLYKVVFLERFSPNCTQNSGSPSPLPTQFSGFSSWLYPNYGIMVRTYYLFLILCFSAES